MTFIHRIIGPNTWLCRLFHSRESRAAHLIGEKLPATMETRHASARFQIGQKREQQDFYLIREVGDQTIIVIADGMFTGDFPARTAATAGTAAFEALLSLPVIALAFQAAQKAIRKAERQKHCSNMRTTLLAAIIENNLAHIGSFGDSRIYSLQGTTAQQLTKDDLVANYGLMLLGNPAFKQVTPQSLILQKGDRLLFCSDGFYKAAIGAGKTVEELLIETQHLPREEAANHLQSMVQSYLDDNETFVLYEQG